MTSNASQHVNPQVFNSEEKSLNSSLAETKPDSLPSSSPEPKFGNSTSIESTPSTSPSPPIYPKPLTLYLLLIGICCCAFLTALDRTIVAVAIPRITDEFKSPQDVGWYGSAYLLTSCSFQPIYGRVYQIFDIRWSFLVSLGIFEVGSLICGVAPSSTTLIVGRAIAGVGCAGIFAGALIVVAISVPLARRPAYMAGVGSIFGVGSVCGPILGGVLTDKATWRWCFYINLPIGFITLIAVIFFFHPTNVTVNQQRPFFKRVLDLDLVGNFLIITTTIMLLLALQWGGTKFAWDSARIIGLIVGAGIEFIIFIIWQWHMGPKALIPLSIISQRTVACALLSSFFLYSALIIHSYYLPLWFQAIKNVSAIRAGVDFLPYVCGNFGVGIITGAIVNKTGWYNPPAILGPVIAIIGSGLLTTLSVNESVGKWVGYEIFAAAGVGMANQQGYLATQAVLPASQVSIGNALMLFSQNLSGAIFVSVGSSVLRNKLLSGLNAAKLPGVDISKVLNAGATNIRGLVPESQLGAVLKLYNTAVDRVFVVVLPLLGIGFVCALGMEWINLQGRKKVDVEPAVESS